MALEDELSDLEGLIYDIFPDVDLFEIPLKEKKVPAGDNTFSGKDVIRIFEKHLEYDEQEEVKDYFFMLLQDMSKPKIEKERRDMLDALKEIWLKLHDIEVIFDILDLFQTPRRISYPEYPQLPSP